MRIFSTASLSAFFGRSRGLLRRGQFVIFYVILPWAHSAKSCPLVGLDSIPAQNPNSGGNLSGEDFPGLAIKTIRKGPSAVITCVDDHTFLASLFE